MMCCRIGDAVRQAADYFKDANSDEYTYELTATDWQSGMQDGPAM